MSEKLEIARDGSELSRLSSLVEGSRSSRDVNINSWKGGGDDLARGVAPV